MASRVVTEKEVDEALGETPETKAALEKALEEHRVYVLAKRAEIQSELVTAGVSAENAEIIAKSAVK